MRKIVASAPRTWSYRSATSWAKDGQEPFAKGLRDLLDFADEARNDDPRPRQPLNISGTGGPFVDDAAAAYGLAMAYVATDDISYAEASARFFIT